MRRITNWRKSCLTWARLGCGLCTTAGLSSAAESKARAASPWAGCIEDNAAFFSSVVDARRGAEPALAQNLTPRGLVVRVGENTWACFDTELLRIAAVWQGPGVTLLSASQISYHEAGRKAADGQAALPAPAGPVWLANGLYPGWQRGTNVSLQDPRERAPSPEEIGLGPLPENEGRFRALRRTQAGVCLEYEVDGSRVEELMTGALSGSQPEFHRTFRLQPTKSPLLLVLGYRSDHAGATKASLAATGSASDCVLTVENSHWVVRVPPHSGVVTFRADMVAEGATAVATPAEMPAAAELAAPTLWPETVITSGTVAANRDAYVVDSISLPLPNPWRRNIRLADIQFLKNGRAYAVTFDGDVWAIEGLDAGLKQVKWRRFAAGFNEPLSLAVRDEQVFVFDRNGIWRLRDTDGDGGADRHELFSNIAAQSADSREYPNGMKLAPDGSFVIVKGGQVDTYFGKHYGSVIRVSADGRTMEVLGWGFRQPFIGVHPRTGVVTASDQEGQYVPTTPLDLVEKGQYYGFATRLRAPEDHPSVITEPVTWIPRQVNPSAASHVWLVGARMGPLTDSLIHLGYNRPEIFSVIFNHRATQPQAAIMSLSRDLKFAPISGAVNPSDGQLYIAGFRIFATTADDVSGLARLRYTGRPFSGPREVVPTPQGILIRFDVALAEPAGDPGRFSVERWNYRRTHNYGSPHFKLDGTLGQDRMLPGSVHLSKDRQSVFVALADMRSDVMQMHVSWSLPAADGSQLNSSVDFTPRKLVAFQPEAEGFGGIQISMSPRMPLGASAQESAPVSVEEGRRLSTFLGCVACHTTDNTSSKGLGPSWKSLYGSTRPLSDDSTVVADEAYIRESILTPGAKIAKGFENGMPIYAGVATAPQIESLVLYIKSLR